MVNQHNLNIEPSVDLQRKIISHLWRKSENGVNIDEYVSYFDQYNRTCRGLYLGALHSESMAIVIQTHENLLEFIDTIWTLVQKNHNFTRPELRAFLEHHDLYKGKSPSKIDNTINVALRVWLTIRIQKGEYAPASNVIDWNDSSGIQDFLSLQFPGPMYQGRSGPEIILESNFTAVNLYRLCGIRVEWVCQLEDHLKFDVDRRVLMVYSLSSCLQDHLNSGSILPSSLARETLRTLSLLFPNWDLQTERFLRNSHQNQLYDYSFEYPGHIHLNEFYVWRDRLARIHHEFQSPGPSWRHLWLDRRNPLQWYTFWFAVAIFVQTLLFGMITIILTFLQTMYSFQSLQLAKAAANSPGVMVRDIHSV